MTPEAWVGRTIAGKYRVETLLGKGGMGLVLHARHIRLDEEVAIKVLLPAMLEVQGMVTRFMREARAASKIKSRHVVRVTDVDVLDDGVPYMVMEYLEGVSLAVLRRREGKLDVPVAARYLLEACEAIAEAHSLGIIHRDLKPANLFLARARDGASEVKVLDFGISKVDAPGEQDTTKTGQMMGSPKYMAPEQMLSMHDCDARADIWSLGAILYDLCTGRTPFVADTVPQLCSLVLNGKPTPPSQLRPDLPPELEAIILRCLEREPANRFPNVAALVGALTPFAAAEMPEGPPASSGVPASDTARGADATPARAPAPRLASTPPSVRGATISAWDAPVTSTPTQPAWAPPGPVGSRPIRRAGLVAASLAVVAVPIVALALHGRGDAARVPVAAAQAQPVTMGGDPPYPPAQPVEAPPPSAPEPARAEAAEKPTLAAEQPAGASVEAPARSLPAVASAQGPAPGAPRAQPRKSARPAPPTAATDDPFGGRRR
jgi:serine/threonine-protein kinase